MKATFALLGSLLALGACKTKDTTPAPAPTPPTPVPIKAVASFTIPDSVNFYAPFTLTNTSTHYSMGTLNWGDGSYPVSLDSTSNIRFGHSYNSVGQYQIKLQVNNKTSSDAISKTIRVVKPRLSPTVLQSLVGNYYGTLHEDFYELYSQLTPHPNRPLVRDTLIRVTLVDNQLLAVPSKLGYPVPFYSSTNTWVHKPDKANYSFQQPDYRDSHSFAQITQTGDSLYFSTRMGGLGSSHSYWFFGKKR